MWSNGQTDMPSAFDLDSYFARIGYEGSGAPSPETLISIHRLHPQAIPFENLDPFLRRPVLLDAVSLHRKLVEGQRGGYCYEHNLLLGHVLKELGFDITGLAARVLWKIPEGLVRPRSHMLLLIRVDGTRYVADVGFGGLTLTSPLRLEVDIEQPTPHEPFRLRTAGDGFVMEAQIAATWKPLYRFDLQEQFLVDYEVSSWYLSNHPASPFITSLMAARPDCGRRYALHNNRFTVHPLDGDTETRAVASSAELREILETVFRIALPGGPEVGAALQSLTES